jgi:hypothetical protein
VNTSRLVHGNKFARCLASSNYSSEIKMISRNRKLLLAAVAVAALMATPLLARTHHTQETAHQARGSAGKAIAAQLSQSKASQLRRGVVCGIDGNASNCLLLPMSLIDSNNVSAPPTEI